MNMSRNAEQNLREHIIDFVKTTAKGNYSVKATLRDHFIEDIDFKDFLSLKFQAAVRAEVKGGVELGYVDYRDQMDPKDVAEAIYSQSGYEAVVESCYDAFLEQEDQTTFEILEQVFNEFWEDLDAGAMLDRDEVQTALISDDETPREIVWDHNEFDPMTALAQNTGTMVFQYQLGHTDGPLGRGSFEWTSTDDAVGDLYAMLGRDRTHGTELDQALTRIVNACDPESGMYARPVFMLSLDVKDVLDIASEVHFGTASSPMVPMKVKVRNPELVLLDAWGGAGEQASIPGEFTLDFDLGRLHLDEYPRSGYGWCDVICQTPSGLGGATFNYEGDAS